MRARVCLRRADLPYDSRDSVAPVVMAEIRYGLRARVLASIHDVGRALLLVCSLFVFRVLRNYCYSVERFRHFFYIEQW